MKKLFTLVLAAATLSGCGETELPKCNDDVTHTLVGQIVNDLKVAKEHGTRFVSLNSVREQGFNKAEQLRACTATLVTTAGENTLQYSIKWQNREKKEFYVELQVF